MTETEKWWGIKQPDGMIRPYEVFNTKNEAIKNFIEGWGFSSWKVAKKHGFSAVKVVITEVQT